MAVPHTMLIIGYQGDYLERINKRELQRYYVNQLQRVGLKVTVEAVIARA
jgi:hypothetical protein